MPASRRPLWLVAGVCVALAFWTLGPGWTMRDGLFRDYGLSREALAAGRWWVFLTHALFHGSWWHAAFNLAGLWVVGRHLSDRYGGSAFSALLVAGVVAGGLAQTATSGDGVLIGISGGVMAMVTAAGLLWDRRYVAVRLGPWRLARMQGRYLGWGMVLGSLILAAASRWLPAGGAAIGHACHAGAALAGALAVGLARWWACKGEKKQINQAPGGAGSA